MSQQSPQIIDQLFPSNVPDIKQMKLLDRDKELYEMKQDIKEIKEKVLEIHKFQSCISKLTSLASQAKIIDKGSEAQKLSKIPKPLPPSTNTEEIPAQIIDELLDSNDETSETLKGKQELLENYQYTKDKPKSKSKSKNKRKGDVNHLDKQKNKKKFKSKSKIRKSSSPLKKANKEDKVKPYEKSDLIKPSAIKKIHIKKREWKEKDKVQDSMRYDREPPKHSGMEGSKFKNLE